MNEQAVKTFMHNFGMSTAALAEFVGIPTPLMNNKLNPVYRNKLSDAEKEAIARYFELLQQRLAAFLDADLETVPGAPVAPENE